jgi:L-threonylcarbamoyladenylate synthase
MLVLPADFNSAFHIFKAALANGEPVIFPTDTIYGLGAPIASVEANELIFEIKKRKKDKPLPILAGSIEQLKEIVELKDNAEVEEERLPGKTYIYRAALSLHKIYAKDGSVAVRLVKDGWLGETLRIVGPITATSVNLEGVPPLLRAEEIYGAFKDSVSYMLWGLAGDKPSEIFGLNGEKIR